MVVVDVSNPDGPIRKGSMPMTNATSVAFSGSTAYAVDGGTYNPYFRIVGVALPTLPSLLGGVTGLTRDRASDVAISGNYAFVARADAGTGSALLLSHSLAIIDIANPATPTLVATYDVPNGYYAWSGRAVSVANGRAYLITDNGLTVLDVSDPLVPVKIGERQGSGQTEICVSQNRACITSGAAGTLVLDVGDPASINVLDGLPTIGTATGVQVVGSRAYIAAGTAGVEVFDVSNPRNAIHIGSFDTSGTANDVVVVGNLLYIADGANGIKVLEVSGGQPSGPSISSQPASSTAVAGSSVTFSVSATGTGTLSYQWRKNGTQVATATSFSFTLNDIQAGDAASYDVLVTDSVATVPSNPATLSINAGLVITLRGIASGFGAGSSANKITVVNNMAYVAAGSGGMVVVDVSNPDGPIRKGSMPMTNATSVAFSGSTAYAVDGGFNDPYFRIIGVPLPTLPSLIGGVTGGRYNRASDVAISGNYAFVARADAGTGSSLLFSTSLAIIDMANPAAPTLVAEYSVPNGFYAWSGRAVSVANGKVNLITDKGLTVLDVSNPVVPVKIGEYQAAGMTDVFVSQNRAYITAGNAGTVILDVADPAAITVLRGLPTSGTATGVQVVGSRAYIAAGTAGVEVFDVSNPRTAIKIGSFDTSGTANDVAVVGNLLYIADHNHPDISPTASTGYERR